MTGHSRTVQRLFTISLLSLTNITNCFKTIFIQYLLGVRLFYSGKVRLELMSHQVCFLNNHFYYTRASSPNYSELYLRAVASKVESWNCVLHPKGNCVWRFNPSAFHSLITCANRPTLLRANHSTKKFYRTFTCVYLFNAKAMWRTVYVINHADVYIYIYSPLTGVI
jgi:hypothetical protein